MFSEVFIIKLSNLCEIESQTDVRTVASVYEQMTLFALRKLNHTGNIFSRTTAKKILLQWPDNINIQRLYSYNSLRSTSERPINVDV